MVVTRAQLLQQGMTDAEIRRQVTRGTLHRLGRGCYTRDAVPQFEQGHLLVARAEKGILAMESAALVHGLPVHRVPSRVQLFRPGRTGSRIRGGRHTWGGHMGDGDVVRVEDVTCTSVERTLVDLARRRPLEVAMVPWEAALWRARRAGDEQGLRARLHDQVEAARHCTGVGRARAVWHQASAWSESPRETASRLVFMELGLPTPVQQFEVVDQSGHRLGRADFAWPDLGILGEYDGQDKYDALARPGERPRDVVRREKRRQEGMEREGWIVLRWGKEELEAPWQLQAAFRRAEALAASRRLVPD